MPIQRVAFSLALMWVVHLPLSAQPLTPEAVLEECAEMVRELELQRDTLRLAYQGAMAKVQADSLIISELKSLLSLADADKRSLKLQRAQLDTIVQKLEVNLALSRTDNDKLVGDVTKWTDKYTSLRANCDDTPLKRLLRYTAAVVAGIVVGLLK